MMLLAIAALASCGKLVEKEYANEKVRRKPLITRLLEEESADADPAPDLDKTSGSVEYRINWIGSQNRAEISPI